MSFEFISRIPVKAVKEAKEIVPKVPSIRLNKSQGKPNKEGVVKTTYVVSAINGAYEGLDLTKLYVAGVEKGKIIIAPFDNGYKVAKGRVSMPVSSVFEEELLAIFGDKTELEVELLELEDGTKYLQTKAVEA